MRALRSRYALGLVGALVALAFIGAALGAYQHRFTRAVMVTVDAPRAGLLMDAGSAVKLRGITVGTVRGVTEQDGHAVLTVALQPGATNGIPSGVTARIMPTSVVGGKYVDLLAPATHGSTAITAGAVIPADDRVPETEDLFQQLVQVLDAVPVDRLDVALSSLSNTLQGRGQRLGTFLSRLDHYLVALNGHAGQISTDLTRAAPVLQTYAAVSPQLQHLLADSTTVGGTLVARRGDLRALLRTFAVTGDTADQVVQSLRTSLPSMLRRMEPVTRLLADYAPQYPCMFETWASQVTNNRSFGYAKPGAQVLVTVQPGQDGYQYPRDLPRFVDGVGPRCYDLPDMKGVTRAPRFIHFDDGEHAIGTDDGAAPNKQPVTVFPPVTKQGKR